MKEGSGIDRIISSEYSETQLKQAQEQLDAVFSNQEYQDLIAIEREKSPEERELIELSNEVLNGYRKRYGLPEFQVPEKNIHVIQNEYWPASGKNGAFKPNRQGVMMASLSNPLEFGHTLFHEMTHFHSYIALEIKEARADSYRHGIEVVTRPDGQQLFTSMNEAIQNVSHNDLSRIMPQHIHYFRKHTRKCSSDALKILMQWDGQALYSQRRRMPLIFAPAQRV